MKSTHNVGVELESMLILSTPLKSSDMSPWKRKAGSTKTPKQTNTPLSNKKLSTKKKSPAKVCSIYIGGE